MLYATLRNCQEYYIKGEKSRKDTASLGKFVSTNLSIIMSEKGADADVQKG